MSKVTELLPYHQGEHALHAETALWRYVPLKTLFFHLDGRVFLPSIAKLKQGDPFEGVFLQEIVWYNEAFQTAFGDRADVIEQWIQENLCTQTERKHITMNSHSGDYIARICQNRLFEFIRRTRYAWCWFESPRESAAMWTIYANQGVAVRSSPAKLKELLQGSGHDFLCRRMRYADIHGGLLRHFNREHPADSALLLRPFFLKRSEYISEQEVRFVTAGPAAEGLDGLVLHDCDPKTWIQEVRFWPGLSRGETDSLRKRVQSALPDIPCERSDLMHADTDGLGELMEGLREIAFKQWAERQDDVPGELKEL